MNRSHLATKLKDFRKQKGMSQEVLAEESGLSLRTIQRIEYGETNPTGDTLKRLSTALGLNPNDLIDWSIKEDRKYLIFLNLSALTFLFFPLLGILVPFILWTSKKDKLLNINRIASGLINFEIAWTIFLFLIPIVLVLFKKMSFLENLTLSAFLTPIALMYVFNMLMILLNTIRISNKKNEVYYPSISFLRE